MIIRLFLILLALNLVAFAVRAEATEPVLSEPMLSERMMAERDGAMSPEDIYEFQEWMSGDVEEGRSDAFAAIGSRLLSHGLVRSRNSGKSYASDGAQADHGIALLNEGACLNLRWNF
ncbi:hypothetical protein B9Q17_16240 [Marinobacter vinifirmus]|uniref:DNA polymerase n=1 Tax=Marinobacter vinifirmus TaxID=355591 RepID=A0A7Z1DV69_9GAMM|nr:hypothetical protein [Marinobacter vinifirmus]OZC36561.1 hypothetical protein B9Q17_16240 [Marinobacter vinifirmus]